MVKIYESFSQMMELNRSVFELLKDKDRDGLLKAIWDARQGEVDQLVEKVTALELKTTEDQQELERLNNDSEAINTRLNEQEEIIRSLHKDEETSIYIIDGLKQNIHKKEKELERMLELLKRSKPYIEDLKIRDAERLAEIKDLKRKLDAFQNDQRDMIKIIQEKDSELGQLKKIYDAQIKELDSKIREIEDQHLFEKDAWSSEKESILQNNNSLASGLQGKLKTLISEKEKLEKELQKSKLFAESLEEELNKVRRNAKQYQVLNHKMEAELYRISGGPKAVSKTKPLSWN
ncbi:MAG: hypothetical protein ACO20H_01600 [Bacteriovoracaceae bacterium]